jgi:SAM-dependent methyltransferase
MSRSEGWHGWDEYADFYDWENARTLGRRDVGFWERLARRTGGPVLELGCGTGRITLPVARTGVRIVGIDRSREMLVRARQRLRRARRPLPVQLVQGDIRELPFAAAHAFALVIAPYGVLQSLLREADLRATLQAVAAITRPGARFCIDLVPDVAHWAEYRDRRTLHGLRGPSGSAITLVESVRQDPRRRLTTFDQAFSERRPGRPPRTTRFSLTFRTLSTRQIVRRLERAGFAVEAVLGDYDGGPWDRRADVWLVVARRMEPRQAPRPKA